MSIGNRLGLAASADPGRLWYIAASGFGLGLLLIIHLLVQGRVAAEQAARRISAELNERKKRADGLKASEKRWQEILDSMPVCRLRPMIAAVRTTDCGHICRLIRAARFPSVLLLVSISL